MFVMMWFSDFENYGCSIFQTWNEAIKAFHLMFGIDCAIEEVTEIIEGESASYLVTDSFLNREYRVDISFCEK